jgi:hypothetical protein
MDNLFFTEKALTHLSGYIASQNSITCSAENPHALHEDRLHSSKIGVWFVVSRKQLAGSSIFEETVTAENYPNILPQFVTLLEQNKRDCSGRPALRRNEQLPRETSSVIAL